MTINEIREVLGWCSVINLGLLLVSFLMMTAAGGFVYRMHKRWFPVTEPQFKVGVHTFFAVYKLLVLVFNVVPYVAMRIVTS